MRLQCKDKPLDLSSPVVMGILNVTPDSFSDGGRFLNPQLAIEQALAMQDAGAAIIDVGGESTRPGAAPVTVQQELQRVIPVIETLAGQLRVPLSIDTSKPEVMRAAVTAGAGMINDVNALQAQGAMQAAHDCAVPVCLMHMQGEPRTMQAAPHYDDVVTDVRAFLERRITACQESGIDPGQIVVDPGFGFGKTLEHNLELLRSLLALVELGKPVLVGMSRKSMIGALTGREEDQRLPGSLAAAVMAVERGASIIRVHDVAETVDAVKFAHSVIKDHPFYW